ncbi:genetic suppressor element 1 isoform X2 [Rhinatrema bivittatum]|uniref:genetic suppressor element 1 isoform X2 n=1 Tax=Rhinatrema bivittatum TaxID=194408 RepID=UPI00112C9678|nr:genetic suppressor element 1 isoform X2 [Rhinatrema bivittatum]
MSEPESAPMSRKQRLMAAIAPGEEPPPPPPLHCFICGGAMSRGRELRLHVRRPGPGATGSPPPPFFPFLQQQEPAPGAREPGPEGCVTACAVCQRFLAEQWGAFERSRTPLDKRMYWLKRPHRGGGDPRRAAPDWNRSPSPGPPDSDLSSLSDQDPPAGSSSPSGSERSRRRPPGAFSDEDSEIHLSSDEERDESRRAPLCYVCGRQLAPGRRRLVHVQKQERPGGGPRPFFPFLWLHEPPPGALPISPAGGALLCPGCASSLLGQWQGFQAAGVPVPQRLYAVPRRSDGQGPPDACYLCGQDCGPGGRLIASQLPHGRAPAIAMHFPFLGSLPLPPEARALSERGEARCCSRCSGVLEDVWAAYRAGQSEELIASPRFFLGRYQQLFGPVSDPGAAAAGQGPICYICGAELAAGEGGQLSVRPPSRRGDPEPFFPFLASYPPALRARPPDSAGSVVACALCSQDLLAQWCRQEAGGGPRSCPPWARRYKLQTFVCFFCRQERERRLGLKAVRVARLPVFLHGPRVPDTLLADDGKELIVGACADCRAALRSGEKVAQGGLSASSSPTAASHKAVVSSLEDPVPSLKTAAVSSDSRPVATAQSLKGSKEPAAEAGFDVESGGQGDTSMSHEPKSPSIGMLSTATRTTATVSPLTPSSLNGSLLPNGSPASNSTLSVQSAPSSSFAAALRKLAKQAEEPRGSSISSESSPVSSPATNHSSPASTPKRGAMGPIIVPPGGHSVPSTPPVVTIAPTKTVNGVWRSESRQADAASRGGGGGGGSRERLLSEPQLVQEKAAGPSVPTHLLATPYSFGIPASAVVQDSRFPPLNLQRPVHHVVPPSAVTEEYLRSFRPYHTAEELRMPSLTPLSLDPATAAAYYPSYLAHHPFPHPAFRMEDSYCLSALRSPFYPIPAPGSLPPLHHSAMHLHMSGVRYPAELTHASLSALQSERLTAERLHLDEELRQREREREREAEREKEREREKELEREKEKERELERQRERAREKELTMAKTLESQFLPVPELHGLRGHTQEEQGKPSEQVTPNRPEKHKDLALQTPKPLHHTLHQPAASQHSLHQPAASQHSLHQPAPASQHSLQQTSSSQHAIPGLSSSHSAFAAPGSSAAAALLVQRTYEEEKWLARQRRLRQEKEDRQYQVSEFRQQVLEQHLEIGRPPNQPEADLRPENLRALPNRHDPSCRDQVQHFGGPPPLISPKPQHPPAPASLWNPVTLMETAVDTRRGQESNLPLHGHTGQYEPSRQALPLVKVERGYGSEKPEETGRRRDAPSWEARPLEHSRYTHGPFLAELEKSTQSILSQQRASLPHAGHFPDMAFAPKSNSTYRPPLARSQDPMYVYDEFLQQHRRLVSKLDLEERRRREAREKGYYYDLDDSYDESDEEEVRAHLRRVAEQPPLKLDTSSEKIEFLQVFGLATLQQKEQVLIQKQRKRRRMLRERSPSPPSVQHKRQTPSPRSPLSTRYSPDDMNGSPNFEEKRRFLTFFNLAHVSTERRKDLPLPPPFPAESDKVPNVAPQPEAPRSPEPIKLEQPRPPEAPRLKDAASGAAEGHRSSETHSRRKNVSILSFIRGPLSKDGSGPLPHGVNGKSRPWEPFLAEEFAHQFHESVLQSTQKALQKHKGAAAVLTAEQNHKLDASIHYNIPELQTSSRGAAPQRNCQQSSAVQEQGRHSEEEETESSEEEEEEDPPRPKWQGIEAIFEAYQEHIEEQNLERQVLQSQCRWLEAQHYSLSLTADQLSHSMAELQREKQKVLSERERLQAELEHLQKCLALPAMQWSRGYFKGIPR